MSTLGSWPLLERLTNEEFLKLLPHLSLEQYYLTQVFVPKKKWIHLLEANLETLQLKCGLCNRQFRFEDIKSHLIQNDHLVSLRSDVKQFYHPFYTYGKVDLKLARGDSAPQTFRENALREVNIHMKSFNKEFMFARQFANIVQQRSKGTDEKQIIETSLAKNIEDPNEMVVMATLPFEDMPKLRFRDVSGEWHSAFGYKNLTLKTLFHCNICFVNCSGIGSLNSHLSGYIHRSKQLDILALCYEDSSRVNKNCCIQFDNFFSFSIMNDIQNSDPEAWTRKLPNEIARKVKALYEYMPKTRKYSGNSLDQEDFERSGKWEDLGHLGVEYVLKIIKSESDRDPKFECGLCEILGDEKKMQRHLLSYDHKKKYLDLHYSDTIKKYEGLLGHMCYKEFRAVMNKIVLKLGVEIEKHHSRSLPYTVSLSDYKARRPDLIIEAYSLLHASQNRGPSFSNVLSKDDIRTLKNSAKLLAEELACENMECIVFTIPPKGKVYLNQMSHDPVVRLREYNAKLNKNRPLRTSRSISPAQIKIRDLIKRGDSRSEQSHTYIHHQRTRSRSPIYGGTKTLINKPESVLNQNIWDIYRHEIAIAANEIETAYENYRKNPESHPMYEEEWNSFWQHRKKQLEREGHDHRSYNFQPEWVHYFKHRIEVLFGEALHKSMVNVRHRLNIPLDAEEDCQRSHESIKQHVAERRMKDNLILNEDIDEYKRHKSRSSPDFKGCAPKNKKVFKEHLGGQKVQNLNTNELAITQIKDNHSNVIHVLRLITALEDHLGSLGRKVMDLLSNALQLEKSYSGNIVEFETKVLTIDNCQLLETAMEKLKGILFAGLLDEKKISGFNRVIQHTANLLKYAEKMGWRQEKNVSDRKNSHSSDKARMVQGHTYLTQNKHSEGGVSHHPAEKTLSDTLIDLVNTSQTNIKQIEISKEQFGNHGEEHPNLPDCPPPPNIKETSINSNTFAGFKGQHSNSGLASFDTKLSLDQINICQKRRDMFLESELGQLKRSKISGGSNLYNNNFKSNNDTGTNINTRTINGSNIGSGMNNNSRTSPQFRNSQIIPNIGQNNTMYQGGGGGNPIKSWSQWNRLN